MRVGLFVFGALWLGACSSPGGGGDSQPHADLTDDVARDFAINSDAAAPDLAAVKQSTPDLSVATNPTPGGITITVEPDGTKVAQNLLDAMDGATTSVHVEMYLLTSTKYLNELIALVGKGIDVKVVLNKTFPTGSTTNDTSYTQLQTGKVNVHWAPTTTGFDNYMHEKTVIIDAGTANAQAWIMTMNLDAAAPQYNREYLAKDTIAADVAEAEAIFAADYAGTSITASGNLCVAPSPTNNAESTLVALINGATKTIDVEAEEYDTSGIEASIATALENRAKAGVTVHMVLENSTDSSQAAAVTALQKVGGKVVGYTYSSTALDIHAKAIVVDSKTAFVGSENLTGGSLGYNRELGVTFATASEVAKIKSTIDADFANGSAYSSK